jgi:hypothetical protein
MKQYDLLGFYIAITIWLIYVFSWYIRGITILCQDAINKRKMEKERRGRQ